MTTSTMIFKVNRKASQRQQRLAQDGHGLEPLGSRGEICSAKVLRSALLPGICPSLCGEQMLQFKRVRLGEIWLEVCSIPRSPVLEGVKRTSLFQVLGHLLFYVCLLAPYWLCLGAASFYCSDLLNPLRSRQAESTVISSTSFSITCALAKSSGALKRQTNTLSNTSD